MLSRSVGNRARSAPLKFRYLFVVATLIGASFIFLPIGNRDEILLLNNDSIQNLDSHFYRVVSDTTNTIKTDGCTIPGLQPFDASVMKFVKQPSGLKSCPNNNSSLLFHNETHIWIERNNLQYYNLSNDANLTCCYKAFYRPSFIVDVKSNKIDDRVVYDSCIYFYDFIKATSEFVRVQCYIKRKKIYDQFYPFAIKKDMIVNTDEDVHVPLNKSAYNVIILGIDAVSRLNFHRTMPKTMAYLRSKGAIELLGYNKVADNTFPNVIPMLLGVKDTDLKKMCWPDRKKTFDNCPFVWESYKDAGYYTALAEDSASLGTFNYGKNGFIGTPTDYYLHTFIHEAEVTVGNNKDFNTPLCMGDRYFYNVLLEYVENLMMTLRSSNLFGFFWEVTMSHDYLNYPMSMDNSYESFLMKLDKTNYLDETILFVLSDHGIRWGDIRYTKQGRLEERLPLVSILLPTSFRANYSKAYENLKLNSQRLTTPFDIYATLNDLNNLDKITDKEISLRTRTSYSSDKKISLFLPVPLNRTCHLADIDDHWCTCHTGIKISVKSKKAQAAAKHLLLHLNKLLHDHRQCSRLTLASIESVTEMTVGRPGKDEVGWREFMVVVRTTPGDGMFEATMRYSLINSETEDWKITGTVSRLNLYGSQSRCIHDYKLKLYCFCKTS